MPLSIQSRRVGDIIIVTCSGRIVAGLEATALQQHISQMLPHDRDFILHLAQVQYIDSSGIGGLVRLLTRTRAVHGDLKLCNVPQNIVDLLRLTNLHTLLEAHRTEEEAVAAFYRRARPAATPAAHATILCVHNSPDVLAYVRELLRQAGYGAITAGNVPDAAVLLTAARPAMVIINSELRNFTGTRAAETFRKAASALPVIELPDEFSSREASDAARHLMEQVRAAANPAQQSGAAG